MEHQPTGEELSACSTFSDAVKGAPGQPRRLRSHPHVRVQVDADLPEFVLTDRVDVLAVYGPVGIGGWTYILPLRSVSIWSGRTFPPLQEWNESGAQW